MKELSLLFLFFFTSQLSGQTDSLLEKVLSTDKFYAVSKRQVPMTLYNQLEIINTHKVGTKLRQCSCTSHKSLVLVWAVTNRKGLYILNIGIPGRACRRKCYVFYNGQKIKDDSCRYDSFEEYKNKSLTKN